MNVRNFLESIPRGFYMVKSNARVAFNLTDREFSNIDDYRKKNNTAVLTIMFTDIQGFTALTENKGETYVHALHEAHDTILVETIEKNGDGIVIKFIGDSIMAVFAEPTAAAEKALLIQRRLAEFNAQRPDLDDIKVRIGLHMGQTVIENKIQTDLFGRHVNKASRIEGLASGGHVYLSYTVFDSVKGWLMDLPNAKYKLHGSYFLKGIDKAEEIYEIWNSDITAPEAPKNTRRLNAIPKGLVASLAAGLFIVAMGGLLFMAKGPKGTNGESKPVENFSDSSVTGASDKTDNSTTKSEENAITQKQDGEPSVRNDAPPQETVATSTEKKPEVFFLGMIAREPILDFDTPLAVTVENEAQGLKKSVNDIEPGKHIVHYIVSYMVRYYAAFDVKPGKNVIQVAFKESTLPSVDIHYNLNADGTAKKSREREGSYFLYDRNTKQRVDYKGFIRAEVEGRKNEAGKPVFAISYAVALNGKERANKEITVTSEPNTAEWTRVPEEILFSEGDHYYFISYEYVNETIQVSVGAAFKD